MLTQEQNELVTRVGPGTPMGELLRRYWMPTLLSWELPEADCPPVRVKLLGEDLVAFRNTSGRIGLLEEGCPHRLATMWLGRNEEDGLRCVYHGWKFDIEGNCVDQMNEPEQFAHKVHMKAYATEERGGVIWAYLGDPAQKPPLPDFEYTRVPETHRGVTKVWQQCNWLQALEGGIDTSHAPILHRAITTKTDKPGIAVDGPFVRGHAPSLEVDFTDYGYRYYGIRDLPEGGQYVRGYHFVMPFTQIRPQQVGNRPKPITSIGGHHWVPMDDENVMVWNWVYSYGDWVPSENDRQQRAAGNSVDDVDPNNGFKSKATRENNWLIDRNVQKYETYTGIPGVNTQDRATQESMGRIVDRTKEHLGPADTAIIATRRLLMEAVKVQREGGTPRGLGASYYDIRAMEKVLPSGPWRPALVPEMDPREKPVAATR